MAPNNSLDEFKFIAASLHDVYAMFTNVVSIKQCKDTIKQVSKRCNAEGLSFLTKTLPKLGKAFDKALTLNTKLTASSLRLASQPGSELPKLMGELFNLVLNPDGSPLPQPNILAVGAIRQICTCFYKYELPYSAEQEDDVIAKFVRAEQELSTVQESLENIRSVLDTANIIHKRRRPITAESSTIDVAREARILIAKVFEGFDCWNIVPSHGPGAVATGQRLWDKFDWKNVSSNIRRTYPLDEYYFSSLSHVCDQLSSLEAITEVDLPARVILVPKDSRGPRLISAEPVDYQWIQQGLRRAIVDRLESHHLTRWNVHFTCQESNRFGALLGSKTGKYVTLDLKEASDRISLGLVRLLFPEPLLGCLESCRTSATELPDGRIQPLIKFAPMGSSLCFPVLATCIWAILSAAAPDEDTRESILVYGDDVIVNTAFAEDAMRRLESFGLLVNRDKSCTNGLFRESCGMDAFNGVDVTPVKFKTVWSSTPSPDAYVSWIAYANAMRRKGYYTTYERIAGELFRIYGKIPATDMKLSCPSLDEVPEDRRPTRTRTNPNGLQRLEWLVRDVQSPVIHHDMGGWSMLLRYFTENQKQPDHVDDRNASNKPLEAEQAFRVSRYTRRNTTKFVHRWKAAEMQLCHRCTRKCSREGACIPVV